MDLGLFTLRILELLEYDREAVVLRWKVAPNNSVKVGQEAGTLDNMGYRHVTIDGKRCLVHRIIFLLEHGYLPDYIDHIDGNPSNNRIENLRPCSQSENMRNASKKSNNTSGVVGVSFHKPSGKWRARCVDRTGKCTHLGLFENKHFAGEVARKFRLENHREFAKEHWITVDPSAIKFLASKLKKPAG